MSAVRTIEDVGATLYILVGWPCLPQRKPAPTAYASGNFGKTTSHLQLRRLHLHPAIQVGLAIQCRVRGGIRSKENRRCARCHSYEKTSWNGGCLCQSRAILVGETRSLGPV